MLTQWENEMKTVINLNHARMLRDMRRSRFLKIYRVEACGHELRYPSAADILNMIGVEDWAGAYESEPERGEVLVLAYEDGLHQSQNAVSRAVRSGAGREGRRRGPVSDERGITFSALFNPLLQDAMEQLEDPNRVPPDGFWGYDGNFHRPAS